MVKAGDWIRVLNTNGGDGVSGPRVGEELQVKCSDRDGNVYLFESDDSRKGSGSICYCGKRHRWVLRESDFTRIEVLSLTEVIKETGKIKSMVKTLGTMMKKLLDGDTQALVKAGYINGDLELTSEGQNELMAILFEANKSSLVAAAKTKLDEEVKK